jgi:N-acetylmuramoyl-L-alanine amidase
MMRALMTNCGRKAFGALAIVAVAGSAGACGSGDGPAASANSATPPSVASSAAAAASAAPTPAGDLAGKVIVIDPGHNGGNAAHPEIINKKVNVINAFKPCNTTGTATNDDYAEHAFTWDVSNRLAKILRDKGAKVILTRKNDKGVGPCVDERAKIANRAHADATLAIHGDGAPASGHGFHVIEPAVIKGHNEKVVPKSDKLGLDIRDAFHQGTGIPYSTYLGKKGLDVRGDLGGLNVATVPAVFIECGNMRNAGDAATMKSPAGRQKMAEALAQGFVKFLIGN